MADENQTPLPEAQTPLRDPSTKDGTIGIVYTPEANPAPIEAETPVLEPEYADDPQAYYDDLRKAFPEERIGQVLRRVRDAKGVSIEALHAITRHSAQKLVSIERMEVSGMSRGYVTPVVRDYAKTIGLNGDVAVRDYSADCGALYAVPLPEPVIASQTPRTASHFRPAYAAAAALALALLGGVAFTVMGSSAPDAAPALVIEPLNGAAESLFADAPLDTRVRVENLELTLVALQDAWVEVRGPDGTLYRNRVMRAGETYIPRLDAGWTISARNGAAFEWRLGDAVIGPLGPEDAAVFAASVDAAAARAQTAAPALAAAGNGQPSR